MQASANPRSAWVQVLAGVGALLVDLPADAAGRVLLTPAGLVLIVLGLRDLLLRPVLSADPVGITLVDGWTRREAAWSEVLGLRVVTDRRIPVLELDLADGLVVLSRRRLGRPPSEVLAELVAIRP